VIEIRWHARAGQGAKTAAQLYALAMLRTGKNAQAFPEYGPERRGAPLRAYTRVDERPIRRHDTIETPDVVVVLEPSLLNEPSITTGLRPDGLLLANSEQALDDRRAVHVPAGRIAAATDSRFVNLIMLGALASQLGEPPLDDLVAAAIELLGAKVPAEDIRFALAAGQKGERWAA
jgi:pyruvate ferredoxin oxidoreductase gamma subunit